MNFKKLLIIICLINSINLNAIQVKLLSNNKEVGLNQPFYVQVRVSGLDTTAGSFQINKNRAFRISDSGISRNETIRIINNKMSKSFTFTKNYQFTGKYLGNFKIGPAYFIYKGKKYRTSLLSIRVTKKRKIKRRRRRHSFFDNFFGRDSEPEEHKDVDVFSELSVSEKNIYVNQLFTLYLDVYLSEPELRSLQVSHSVKRGFWEDLPKKSFIRGPKEVYKKGKKWFRYRRILSYLYPASSGQKKIPGIQTRLNFKNYWMRSKLINVKGIGLNIKNVPEHNKPRDFSGYIGDLKMEMKVITERYNRDVPFELSVILEGSGNIQTITSLNISNNNKNIRILSPTINTIQDKTIDGLKSKRIFTYQLYPLVEGRIKLPIFKFSYFNPNTKNFIHTETTNMFIEVLKAIQPEEKKKSSDSISSMKIKAYNLGQRNYKNFMPVAFEYLIVLLVVFIIITSINFWIYKRDNYYSANPELDLKLNAFKSANKLLKKAMDNKDNNNLETLGLIEKSLRVFVLRKLGSQGDTFILNVFVDKLKAIGINEDKINEFKGIIEECSSLRYTNTANSDRTKMLLNNAKNILGELQKEWPKNTKGKTV